MKKREFQRPMDTTKHTNMLMMGVPRGEERENPSFI
jgi:hypothetical protein